MDITEIRIKLFEEGGENERLHAFCSITFDNWFVVRDLKTLKAGAVILLPCPVAN